MCIFDLSQIGATFNVKINQKTSSIDVFFVSFWGIFSLGVVLDLTKIKHYERKK